MTLLVMTPIQQEYDALARFFEREQGMPGERALSGRLAGLRFARWDLILAQGGLGKAQFALQAQHLIDGCPQAKGLICAGTGGALGEGIRAGDVVVATETVEHDCIYKFARRGPPRFPGDPALLSALHEAVRTPPPFRVHFGPVASGDEDVIDRKRAAEIQRRTGALAVAWEGAGGARACRFSGLPYLEIRGVSDGSNPLALLSFIIHLGSVMEHIGWLILRCAAQAGSSIEAGK